MLRVFALLLAVWTTGFAPTLSRAQIPTVSTKSPYVAAEGKALLVFVRPRKRLAEEVLHSVVDEQGRCIAVLGNGWTVVAPVRPGARKLLVVTGVAQPTVQLLKVKATVGNTYVVMFRPRVNAKRPVDITILRKSEQTLEKFPPSVLESGPFHPDLRDCSAWVASRRGRLVGKASDAKADWNEEDDEFRAAHTIRPADGWSASEIEFR